MISVVIPAYNEAGTIGDTLAVLQAHDRAGLVRQIIVADGGGTATRGTLPGAQVLLCDRRGRAAQMNAGAALATEPILYFLHADTRPPLDYSLRIAAADAPCGCFRLSFDDPHWFLAACAWFTRFNINEFRFGDQSLFVERELFRRVGGFREDLLVLEDQEIVVRLRRQARFQVLPDVVRTSARKYRQNGIFRTQAVFTCLYLLARAGLSQTRVLALYRRWIRSEQL